MCLMFRVLFISNGSIFQITHLRYFRQEGEPTPVDLNGRLGLLFHWVVSEWMLATVGRQGDWHWILVLVLNARGALCHFRLVLV